MDLLWTCHATCLGSYAGKTGRQPQELIPEPGKVKKSRNIIETPATPIKVMTSQKYFWGEIWSFILLFGITYLKKVHLQKKKKLFSALNS